MPRRRHREGRDQIPTGFHLLPKDGLQPCANPSRAIPVGPPRCVEHTRLTRAVNRLANRKKPGFSPVPPRLDLHPAQPLPSRPTPGRRRLAIARSAAARRAGPQSCRNSLFRGCSWLFSRRSSSCRTSAGRPFGTRMSHEMPPAPWPCETAATGSFPCLTVGSGWRSRPLSTGFSQVQTLQH